MSDTPTSTGIGWTAAKALAAINILIGGWLFHLVVTGSQEASEERAAIITEHHTANAELRERIARLEEFKKAVLREQGGERGAE